MDSNPAQPRRLFLLDAYALIFRAYYALIKMPRITQAGFNTSAIFGFVNTLEELLRKENPTHIAVAFDPPGPTFRHEADEAYKAERAATPEDIKLSVPVIKDIIRAYRIPILEVAGFEADDVIGTMARRAADAGFTTYMMTPDKDFGQLVGPRTLQYKPSYRGQDFEIRGEEEICARYGLQSTRQVIDLLALMGDKSDNIPGCPGVGEKTAVKLITDFGGVDALLENTDRLKGALRKKVEENAEKIRFSRFLATIRTDVPLAESPDDLARREPDTEKLFAIFRDLEFRTLADRVQRRLDADAPSAAKAAAPRAAAVSPAPAHAAAPLQPSLFDEEFAADEAAAPQPAREIARSYEIADTPALLDRLAASLEGKECCGLFILASGEGDMEAEWKGAAVATAEGCATYIPADTPGGIPFLLDLMARPDIVKVTPQAKRDYVMAARRRIILNGQETAETDYLDATPLQSYLDISLAHYLVQPEMRHTVEALAETYLGCTPAPAPEFAPKGRARGFTPPTPEQLRDYACEQADLTLRLRAPLLDELRREEAEKMFYGLELPLAGVLARMELAGVRVDVGALDDAASAMTQRLDNIQKEIYAIVGEEFNISSPARVGEILFDRLALEPKPKKTKTGQYTTSEEALEKVAAKNPAVPLILLHRQLRKLLSTYLTALPASINPATGKIHTTYQQSVTATGRLSSTGPNLQNIPVREGEGRDIRAAFIADPGHIFLSADYSQIELRLAADFSGDPTMLEAFRTGDDIHAITAAKIYHKDVADVTADERRHAKTANFGILYGISAFGLATRLGIPRADAKTLIDNYFQTFPAVRQYMSDSIELAREKGYVQTREGRKRRLPDINSRNPTVRGYAERNAINAPLQGTAADIIKRAMIDIDAEMRRLRLRSRMTMQVHDELNFDVIPEELPQVQELVGRLMEGAYSGAVTLTAESGVADNWLDAH